MSAIANIVAFDGAATPVSHTLTPISVSREKGEVIAEYRETGLSTVPAYAQPRVTLKLSRLKSGIYRTETRVAIPVMEAVLNQNAAGYTAAPKVAYENTVVMTGFFHERSSVAERRLARQLAVNIAGGVATSVTPVTTHAFGELYDLLVAPT
ncbi:MAG: hypothetical protein [Sanya fiers-like virus 22]|nr:MAG: hypothetical protein [Sanya fiers-like virus 22]